jgi:hypothetical protein
MKNLTETKMVMTFISLTIAKTQHLCLKIRLATIDGKHYKLKSFYFKANGEFSHDRGISQSRNKNND